MDIGSTLLSQDIALFTREEAEEALMVMRYFLDKEKSGQMKKAYLAYITQLEEKLAEIYNPETEK